MKKVLHTRRYQPETFGLGRGQISSSYTAACVKIAFVPVTLGLRPSSRR